MISIGRLKIEQKVNIFLENIYNIKLTPFAGLCPFVIIVDNY